MSSPRLSTRELSALKGQRFRKLFTKYGYYEGVVVDFSVKNQTVVANFDGEHSTIEAAECKRLVEKWNAASAARATKTKRTPSTA
jgi:hypothetical protein